MSPPTPVRIAVDTNFLIDLAEDNEQCWACLEKLQGKQPRPQIVATPTAIQELAHLMMASLSAKRRALAQIALSSMIQWSIVPMNLVSVGHGIVEQISDQIRGAGVLPMEERHDGLIIAEAALGDCDFLVSSDGHLTTLDPEALSQVLREADVKEIFIVSPRTVLRIL